MLHALMQNVNFSTSLTVEWVCPVAEFIKTATATAVGFGIMVRANFKVACAGPDKSFLRVAGVHRLLRKTDPYTH